ncbi:butyrate kinase, partial [Clostridium perfringens]|nr:butyrate kinase [Clostridium perfringens]
MSYKLLIINPGSTSTKIGVYQDEKEVFIETLRHSAEEIGEYESIYDQFLFRKEIIIK